MAKILVVEDDENTNEVITNFLLANGHDVVNAKNGSQAIKLFDETVVLIILDIMLPDMSGFDILDYVRNKNENVIIIILSAITDEVTQLLCYEKNVDEYVEKPFSPAILMKKVNIFLKHMDSNSKKNIAIT